MTSLADKLLARVGKTRAEFASNSKVGRAFRRAGVKRTADFERILYMPRRDWRDGSEELAELLTATYARPPSAFCSEDCVCRGSGHMELWPLQAAGLGNFHDFGGLFGSIVVGGGKTLISFLSPAVVEAERPLLLVPAKLRKKTDAEWWKLAVHWKLPQVRIESYERLSVAKNAKLLQNYKPDLIIADEAHRLRNTRAAVTRRVARYLRSNPTRMIIMSGTLTTKSLRDYWHLLKWTLGGEQMPMPAKWDEMMSWADCLDVKSNGAVRTAPGVLLEMCDEEERANAKLGHEAELEAVRSAFRRRLVESPGVVATTDKFVECSLQITSVDVPLDSALEPHYKKLRRDWQTPDGWDFTEAVDQWRHARELACGFYNVWDPRPPDEWMAKRRNWKAFARSVLKHSQTLDTEFQVASAAVKGDVDTWVEVEERDEHGIMRYRMADVYADGSPSATRSSPTLLPVWVDDTMLDYAAEWLARGEGIVWVEYPAFGKKLSKMTGLPYFGRGGLDADGTMIEETKHRRVMASVSANSVGRNLQFQWHRNLVVSCIPNAKVIEQMWGVRTATARKRTRSLMNSCWPAASNSPDSTLRFDRRGTSNRLRVNRNGCFTQTST